MVSGVRGVIVTEALHIPVIVFGVSVTIASAWWQSPRSPPRFPILSNRAARLFNFRSSPRRPLTVWVVVFGISVGNLTNYIGDQMSLSGTS